MGPTIEVNEALKTFALGGFLTTSTLIIGFNFKIFTNIFKDNTRKYWWLFLITAIIPILIILYIFSLLFR